MARLTPEAKPLRRRRHAKLLARRADDLDAGEAQIGVSTPQWAEYTGQPLTNSLETGVHYDISNEHENDPDLCMLTSGNAFLLYTSQGCQTQSLAVLGTVKLTSVSGQWIAGSFDVVMGGPYGQADAGTTNLSGVFGVVPACT
jgi:hypothetical protein